MTYLFSLPDREISRFSHDFTAVSKTHFLQKPSPGTDKPDKLLLISKSKHNHRLISRLCYNCHWYAAVIHPTVTSEKIG